jgi:hypothetical protein
MDAVTPGNRRYGTRGRGARCHGFTVTYSPLTSKNVARRGERGIKVSVEQVKLLKQATILHWEFNHFVVFDKVVKGGVRIATRRSCR